MPRLSTIIPHRGNTLALENTILSVLENQTDDCEVILVHDGSYSDPYNLSDELLIIEEQTDNPVTLLNVGLMAACSPTICVLTPGATLQDGSWITAVKQINSSRGVGAVAVETLCGSASAFGITAKATKDSSYMQRGTVDQKRQSAVAGPSLMAGFYDRKTLLALDGWNEQLSWENADIEMALLLNHLGIHCELAPVQVNLDHTSNRCQTNTIVKQLAEVSVAYGVSGSGTSTAMTDLLRGCLTGHISAAVAWSTGIMSAARGVKPIQDRIENAKHNYAQLVEQRQASLERVERRAAA